MNFASKPQFAKQSKTKSKQSSELLHRSQHGGCPGEAHRSGVASQWGVEKTGPQMDEVIRKIKFLPLQLLRTSCSRCEQRASRAVWRFIAKHACKTKLYSKGLALCYLCLVCAVQRVLHYKFICYSNNSGLLPAPTFIPRTDS